MKTAVFSFLRSGIDDMEILILDDCSSDDTEQLALELTQLDRRISYRRHKKNLGHIATFNEGLNWASKKYFLIISADDVFYSKFLRWRLSFLDKNPNVVFSYSPVRVFFQSGEKGHISYPPIADRLADRVYSGEEFLRLSLTNRLCLPSRPLHNCANKLSKESGPI
ncbi:MAG: glycosyltransferase family 2 protein [Acidobacteria bacterium]|nr:glycosyltransferase family 2 protein [Acidobacteriota bacterium]